MAEGSIDVKRQYVDAAYELICEAGMENASAREIARTMGKTAPAVYYHFESLDRLLAIAAVRFLKPYYENVAALTSEFSTAIDISTWA